MTEQPRGAELFYPTAANHLIGKPLHLLELRAELQQEQVDAGGFEFRNARGDLLGRTYQP